MKQNRRKWIATQSWSSPKYSNHQKSERKSFHEDQWIGLRENLQESPIENNGKIWENRWFPVPIFPNKPIHWEDPWSRAIRTHAQKDCAVHSSSLEFTRVHFTQGSLYLMIMSKPTLVRNPTKPGSEPSQFWSAAPPFTSHFHVNVDFFSGVKPKLKIRIWWIYIYILYYIYYILCNMDISSPIISPYGWFLLVF